MKKQIQLCILTAILICIALQLSAQVGVNSDGSFPDPSAMLDVKSSVKGMLIPRVALTSVIVADPIISPALGLLVYNTATLGIPPNNVVPGIYFWNGARWVVVSPPFGTNTGDMLFWNGTQWEKLSVGANGQSLILTNGVPSWGLSVAQLPIVSTNPVLNILAYSAISGGNISDGGALIIGKGVCWSTSPNPTIANNKTSDGSGSGSFNSNITNLIPNTIYYLRAYATNNIGTGYGNEITFSTSNSIVNLTTSVISNILATSASCGGNVISDGGLTVTSRGICWGISTNPTIVGSKTVDGSGLGVFISNLNGLAANTMYYVRAYATNNLETFYGNEVSFTTSSAGGVPCPGIPTIYYGGQTYNTVQIGTQCWLKENLNIGSMVDSTQNQTDNNTIEKYCYRNLESNCNIYGGLYQWAEMVQYYNWASNTSTWNPPPTNYVQGLCPPGWHLPTNEEFCILITYLDPTVTCAPGNNGINAGGKMKETTTIHWLSPNYLATNLSGFTALPSGQLLIESGFQGIPNVTYFRTASEYSASNDRVYSLNYGEGRVYIMNLPKVRGEAVRCLKD